MTFSWGTGSGVSQYFLYVGRSQGANDIFGNYVSCCSQTVSNIPTDGSTIWVRMWSNFSTGWQYNDYSYHASTVISCPTGQYKVEYFNNQSLSGSPTFARCEYAPVIYDWGTGGPGNGLATDHFSVRWMGTFYFNPGNYNFHVETDDGMQIWVDGGIFLSKWFDQVGSYDQAQSMSAGYHTIKIEYYENGGGAKAKVSWAASGYAKAGITNPSPGSTLAGSSATFNWSTGSGVTQYFLYVGRSQGANDIFGNYVSCCSQTVSNIPTDGSTIWVRMWSNFSTGWQYNDYSYRATVSSRSTVIVDDQSSGFVRGGTSAYWYQASIGYNSHIWWTYNRQSGVDDWGKWTPGLDGAGNYEVFAYIPCNYATTTNAGYRIHHNGGDDVRRPVNQYNYCNQWVSLGTYYFNDASDEYVFMGDETFETSSSRMIGFDAMQFVPR